MAESAEKYISLYGPHQSRTAALKRADVRRTIDSFVPSRNRPSLLSSNELSKMNWPMVVE